MNKKSYLDCHYYEPCSEDFDGCPGPHQGSVECETCPYGKISKSANKPVEADREKDGDCENCGFIHPGINCTDYA